MAVQVTSHDSPVTPSRVGARVGARASTRRRARDDATTRRDRVRGAWTRVTTRADVDATAGEDAV